jgi:hypothetical protein
MGVHLNSEGWLTESQKEQADALGMPHEEYREILIQRLEEIRGGAAPSPDYENMRKVTKVSCKNPVLVIGHGPSFKNDMEGIRNWKYTRVATDVCLDDLLKEGIIPDYVVTSEASRQTCALWGFDPERLVKNGIKVRHSSITRNDVIEPNKNAGVDIKLFDFEEEVRCSNVGLFALNFCVHELKADKIFMVGMEHNGTEYTDYTYRVWATDFWYFVRKWPKQIIVNCSRGGILYFRDHTLEGELDDLDIIKG